MKKILSLSLFLAIFITICMPFGPTISAAEIEAPDNAADSNIKLEGGVIPSPIYTVTIPTAIDFGICEKKMENDTQVNKIKEVNVDSLSITHSNLFVNEKQVAISINSDFIIRNDDSVLNFELFNANLKIKSNDIIFVAFSTTDDNNQSQGLTLTAKLDQSTIKKAAVYQGTVTFTVSLDDIA